jgi:hypothetical protein
MCSHYILCTSLYGGGCRIDMVDQDISLGLLSWQDPAQVEPRLVVIQLQNDLTPTEGPPVKIHDQRLPPSPSLAAQHQHWLGCSPWSREPHMSLAICLQYKLSVGVIHC